MNLRHTLFLFIFLLPFAIQSQSKREIGKQYLKENAEKFGLTQADVNDFIINDMYESKHNGVTHIYFNQSHNGIPVYNAILNVNITKDNEIPFYGNRFISDLKSKISTKTPKLSAEEAVIKVTEKINIVDPGTLNELKRTSKNSIVFEQTRYSRSPIRAKLVYYQVNENQVNLAWDIILPESATPDQWSTRVDAVSGKILDHVNRTLYCQHHKGTYHNHDRTCRHNFETKMAKKETATSAAAMVDGSSYRVYEFPIESPIHGDATLVSEPAIIQASPYGWHDTDGAPGPEFTYTRGNNAFVYSNTDANNVGEPDDYPDVGPDLNFDFIHDQELEPDLNVDADVVNLFYAINMMHDLSYLIGFDEAAGNFQTNNYGNGGIGNDNVIGFALDSTRSIANNAYFSISNEGDNGLMGMHRWDVGGSSLFRVNEPIELDDNYSQIAGAGDGWGFDNTYANIDITAKLIPAFDSDPQNPETACGTIANADELNGNIALIQRGLCEFGTKSLNAQNAGAVAVIICNVPGADGAGSDGEQLIGMAGGADGLNVTIPAIFMPRSSCQRFLASINAGIPVVANMNLQENSGPSQISSGFDNGVIAHEYGHGISSRLIGGPSSAGCLRNDEQMGEGISDWFSLIVTAKEGDSGTDARGIGNYIRASSVTGRGIRRFPYSTDFSINPQTYDNIKVAVRPEDEGSPHPAGEPWANTAWEIYWLFVDLYGFDSDWTNTASGNHQGMRLVMDGMKLAPCSPGYLDMRDALLAADQMNYDGIHSCMMWDIFAKRGLGYFADQGSAEDNFDNTENFEPLPTCIKELKIRKEIADFVVPGDDLEVSLYVANHTEGPVENAVISDIIPAGLSYVAGSASFPHEIQGDRIIFDLGDYPSLAENTITYSLTSDPNIYSSLLIANQVESQEDIGLWDREIGEGQNFFQITSLDSYSPSQSWFVAEVDGDTQQPLFYRNLDVVGDYPVLRVYHRMNTINTVRDGGFIEVSTDQGTTWNNLGGRFVKGGYNNILTYTTFAIPNLEGFAGEREQGDFLDSYIDLSEYAGQNIDIRFRFGTSDAAPMTTLNVAPDNGWFIDDFQLIDMLFYDTEACLNTSGGDACSGNKRTFIDARTLTNTSDLSKEGVSVLVYPNPASDYFIVEIHSELQREARLSLVGVDGKEVYSRNIRINPSQNNLTVNTSNVPSGFYFVQIESEGKILNKKIMID